MDQPKRKHRATGKPRGGARSGAGRREGSTNALRLGEVRAVKAAGLRVPETASEAERKLADRAQQRIIDVMEEKVGFLKMPHVLKAAATLREEICGPVSKKVAVTGADGGPLTVKVVEFTGDGDD